VSFRIAPSLASAPSDHLSAVIVELEIAGADYIHFDIEDGSFVPVMTLGTKLIADLRRYTRLPFDVHLMMENPEWLVPELVTLGANRISVHYEACLYPRRVLRRIVSSGPDLTYLKPYLSFVLILTTEPEMPDCPFLPEVLDKVRQGRQTKGLDGIEWMVDGGVNSENIASVVAAGADTVVVGRSVFKENKIAGNIQKLRNSV
jgi:ribulose-phosphate 3-epimerase